MDGVRWHINLKSFAQKIECGSCLNMSLQQCEHLNIIYSHTVKEHKSVIGVYFIAIVTLEQKINSILMLGGFTIDYDVWQETHNILQLLLCFITTQHFNEN